MRFGAAHKMSTYLTVVSAYLALVLSGELSAVTVGVSGVGIAASWLWEPPRVRVERWTRVWTAVAALAFAYEIAASLATGDFLLSGARLLLVLLVVKVLSRRTNKDYQHIYILTFLMLVASTVLNPSITYGLCFLAYVVAVTWALILFHLRREMEDNFLLKHSDDRASEPVEVSRILNSRRIVGKTFFVGTSLVSLSIFAVATMLFLLIPRIGFGLFFEHSRSNISMAGFSDDVDLGGHGVIRDNDTVVMRVTFEDGVDPRELPPIHWRGVAFDHYEAGGWSRSDRAPETRVDASRARGAVRYTLRYGPAGAQTPPRARVDDALRQDIYLEPLGYDVLFAASMPIAFEFSGSRDRPRRERNDEVRYPHSSGIKYRVYSAPEPPPANALREAPPVIPQSYRVYLQLPDDLPPRVAALAREITRGADTRYDKVQAIVRWLQEELTYTRTMESPGASEPIDFFLFERKRGHCEYFASSMAVLARAAGIPTRNVNGFLGGEWNDFSDYLAVRAGDAHSWVEVYFHGLGWVAFDPTPSGGTPGVSGGAGSVLDDLRRLADTIRFQWFKWVIEYDLYRQLSLLERVSGAWGGAGSALEAPMDETKAWLGRHRAAAIASVILAAVLTALVALWRRRRRGPGTGRPAARRRSPVAASYHAALARLARRGFGRAPSATPREHAADLVHRDAPGAAALAELAELLYAAEFGVCDVPDAQVRARELSGAVIRAVKEAPRRRAGGERA